MPYLFLFFSVLCYSSSSISGKYFNRKNEKNDVSSYYNLFQALVSFFTWGVLAVISGGFNVNILPYSLGFAFFISIWCLSLIRALKTGSASVTSLFLNFSNIIVSVYGVVFWNNKLSFFCILGLVFAVVSLVLCICGDSDKKSNQWQNSECQLNDGKRSGFSVRWLIYCFLVMFANSGCAIVQREQQIAFNYEFGNLCMAFAAFFSFIFFVIIFLLRKDKTQIPEKGTLVFPVVSGVLNVGLNFFVILLAPSNLSPSFIYPTIGIGGLVLVILFSRIVFKEKITPIKLAGLIIGLIATALLSI